MKGPPSPFSLGALHPPLSCPGLQPSCRGRVRKGRAAPEATAQRKAFVVFIIIYSLISACGSRSFWCQLRDLIWGGAPPPPPPRNWLAADPWLGELGGGRRLPGPTAHLARGPVYVTLQVGLGFIIFIPPPPPLPFRDKSVYIFPPYFYSWPFTGW